MPAGLTMLSPSLSQLPEVFTSYGANAASDIIAEKVPLLRQDFPSSSNWPSDPPRGHFYCETSMLNHPLICPSAAQSWQGSPPMWIAAGGGERSSDSARVVAQVAAQQGVMIQWEEYEAMPHIWMMSVKSWWQSSMAMWERRINKHVRELISNQRFHRSEKQLCRIPSGFDFHFSLSFHLPVPLSIHPYLIPSHESTKTRLRL